MRVGRPELERAAFFVTFAASASILFSIAVAQILMGTALVLLLASRAPLRVPPVWLPAGVFMAGTVVSLLASGEIRHGLPQIRKFYVWVIALLVFSTFRRLREVRWMVAAWTAVASVSAAYSLVQFVQKFDAAEDAGQNFYQSYVARRITGFMSHWMTFGGEEMVVLLFLAAFLFFAAASRRWKLAGCAGGAVLLASMVLGFTRSVWLGTLAGGLYLLWFWRRWAIAVVPLALVSALFVTPVRERVESLVRPHGERDSNEFRIVVWRTGLEMIRAHPLLGLGPEQVGPQLEKYVPADIARPLPPGYYGHLHNIYIHYAAERGIPTMLAMMWLIGQALWDFASTLWRKRPSGDAKFVLHGAMAVILALLVVGCFEYNLGDSEVLTLFLTTICFGYLAKESVDGRASGAKIV